MYIYLPYLLILLLLLMMMMWLLYKNCLSDTSRYTDTDVVIWKTSLYCYVIAIARRSLT